MIQAILLDFGNVLGFFDHRRATRRFAPSATLTESEMLAAIYDGDLEVDFESGRISGDEFLRRAAELVGYRGTIDSMRDAFVDIFTPNPPVLDLLPRLARRYRLVLASNTNELHSAHFRVSFAEPLREFHALGMSWQAGVRKPDRRFFEYCLGLAGCRAEEAVFIDDIAANVAGAESLGIGGIVYRPDTRLTEELARFGITDL